MGRIQSQFGLVTGTDILGTVDQLISISARPRDRLIARTEEIAAKQQAIVELTASVIGVQLAGNRLTEPTQFRTRSSTSSQPEALSVTAGSAAAEGSYTVRTLQTAATHKVESAKTFESAEEALGFEGTIEVARGGFLDRSTSLSTLNGGRGVEAGTLRLTDRSGRSDTISTAGADSIDDIVDRINDADVGIRASTVDGAIELRDTTGATDSNLVVTQLGEAETAADLGLFGIDVAADTATGTRLVDEITANTKLSDIGDGVDLSAEIDFEIDLSDGSTLAVDLGDFSIAATPPTAPTGETTPANAEAGLQFTDLTAGQDYEGLSVTFENAGFLQPTSATLTGTGSGSTLVIRLASGATASDVQSVLASDNAINDKIQVDLTGDGSGVVSTADVASLTGDPGDEGRPTIMEPTLQDLIDYLNDRYDSYLSVSFDDGQIAIEDLTGGGGPFTIRDGDGSSFASDLRLLGAADASTITGTLETDPLRGVSLSRLDGGSGLGDLSTIDIELRDGSLVSVDLTGSKSTAEVVDRINAAGGSVLARLDQSGTALRLRDVSGGSGEFAVTSSDDTAAKLGLDAAADGSFLIGDDLSPQIVDRGTSLSEFLGSDSGANGSFTITDSSGNTGAVNVAVDNIETFGDLIDQINSLGLDVEATLSPLGDGIAVIDRGDGSNTLAISDATGDGLAARLNLDGTVVDTTIAGVSERALVGTDRQSITVAATDTLSDIVEKLGEDSRYATVSIAQLDDGRVALSASATAGGASGRFALRSEGFHLGLRTTAVGQDARIAYSIDGGAEVFATSTDGVFELAAGDGQTGVSRETLLSEIVPSAVEGSFILEDSSGERSAINLRVDDIRTYGDLVDRVNGLGIAVEASLAEDGGGLRLVDTGGGNETFTVTDVGNSGVAAFLGIAGEASSQTIDGQSVSAIVSSVDDAASGEGLSFTLKELSEDPITVTVEQDNEKVVGVISTFVDQYNSLVEKLDSVTFFNGDTNSVGVLFGSSETLRIRSSYQRLLSGSIRGAGDFRSAGQVGLKFSANGKLQLDRGKLREALEETPQAVEAFFATDGTGLADQLSDVAERLAGASGGVLTRRRETLQNQTERNNERIDSLNGRLVRERERLLEQFFRAEEAISRIQSDQDAVSSIRQIAIPE